VSAARLARNGWVGHGRSTHRLARTPAVPLRSLTRTRRLDPGGAKRERKMAIEGAEVGIGLCRTERQDHPVCLLLSATVAGDDEVVQTFRTAPGFRNDVIAMRAASLQRPRCEGLGAIEAGASESLERVPQRIERSVGRRLAADAIERHPARGKLHEFQALVRHAEDRVRGDRPHFSHGSRHSERE
jgi:hypothetical protein